MRKARLLGCAVAVLVLAPAAWSQGLTHMWSKGFGDILGDAGSGIAVDYSGNVLVTGMFWNTVDFGGGPITSAGNRDIFVAKFGAPCVANGDVNDDGFLTPEDALCAFNIFLSGGVVPPDCDVPDWDCEVTAADVNCDGRVTPGDALEIFNRYLAGGDPEECFAATVHAPLQ